MTVQDKILEIKKKVNQNSLFISRVPLQTRVKFVELAKEEFENDYGMTLKWILDFRNGLLSNPNQIMAEQIEILTAKVQELEEKPVEEPEEKKKIKSVSGRVIKKG